MATGSDVRDILSLPAASSGRGSGVLASQPQPQHSEASSSSRGPQYVPPHGAHGGARPKPKKPRVDGISRELYALLGDSTPSLTFAHGIPGSGGDGLGGGGGAGDASGKFMPKYRKRPQRVQRWVQGAFRNPARSDQLALRHWIPAAEQRQVEQLRQQQQQQQGGQRNVDDAVTADADASSWSPPRAYRFADLNTSSGVYNYSNDEYHQHLRDEDWTKEETDHLMDLCSAYDLRFVIIADRFNWPGRERSMEDLKARYYAICRRLIRSRISTQDVEQRQQLLLTYSFDRNREVDRKKHVARLFSRTPQQLAEEEALYIEARRLEQNENKFATEREELLRLLGGWERTPNIHGESVAAAGAGVGLVAEPAVDDEAARRSRKRRASEEAVGAGGLAAAAAQQGASNAPGAGAGAAAGAGAVLTAKQKAELKTQQFDETHNITRFDPQAAASTPSKPPYPHLMGTPSTYPPVAPATSHAASHGAYLRSQRMLTPRSNLLLKTQEVLAELEPPVSLRMTFPTRTNCEKWEGVVGAVTSGLEMKRQLDRVQSELRIAHMRLQGMSSSAAAAASGAHGHARTTSVTPAPGAAAAGQQQHQRQASVISTTGDASEWAHRDSVDQSAAAAASAAAEAAPPSSDAGDTSMS